MQFVWPGAQSTSCLKNSSPNSALMLLKCRISFLHKNLGVSLIASSSLPRETHLFQPECHHLHSINLQSSGPLCHMTLPKYLLVDSPLPILTFVTVSLSPSAVTAWTFHYVHQTDSALLLPMLSSLLALPLCDMNELNNIKFSSFTDIARLKGALLIE